MAPFFELSDQRERRNKNQRRRGGGGGGGQQQHEEDFVRRPRPASKGGEGNQLQIVEKQQRRPHLSNRVVVGLPGEESDFREGGNGGGVVLQGEEGEGSRKKELETNNRHLEEIKRVQRIERYWLQSSRLGLVPSVLMYIRLKTS